MLCLDKEILFKLLNIFSVKSLFEIIAIEFHQLRRSWIFLRIYKPPVEDGNKFIKKTSNILNKYVHQYKNILIARDSNITIGNPHLENIMHLFDLTTLINTPTCYLSH